MQVIHACDAQLSFVCKGNFRQPAVESTKHLEDAAMSSLLKSAVLSLGVLAGTAAVALAQSVSSLPPSNPATAPTAAAPSQLPAGYEADKSLHPYSSSVGPQIGSHNSGKDVHYEATEGDNDPSRHPYTSTNFGPRPH
jgi:hypothetical protein